MPCDASSCFFWLLSIPFWYQSLLVSVPSSGTLPGEKLPPVSPRLSIPASFFCVAACSSWMPCPSAAPRSLVSSVARWEHLHVPQLPSSSDTEVFTTESKHVLYCNTATAQEACRICASGQVEISERLVVQISTGLSKMATPATTPRATFIRQPQTTLQRTSVFGCMVLGAQQVTHHLVQLHLFAIPREEA
jgi:hypothetical protein